MRVEPAIEAAVVKLAFDYPAFSQLLASNELRKLGVFISPGGFRSVWLRHDLKIFDKRLKALEASVAQDGIILTKAQVIAMERKQEKREAFGEIETEHPGYLGSQDTYYVGNIKGVGHIYQQTFIDTYSRVAFANSMKPSMLSPLQACSMIGYAVGFQLNLSMKVFLE